jgi:hydroxymethylglutaryl-CoA reductase
MESKKDFHKPSNAEQARGVATDTNIASSKASSKEGLDRRSSRLPGFYELPVSERLKIIQDFAGLSAMEARSLHNFGVLSPELTDVFIENAVGTFGLPLGVATNFKINGRDMLVPMAVEETSVLAAASHGAKLARQGGGFHATSTASVMTGQIQLFLQNAPCEDSDGARNFEINCNKTLNDRKLSLLDYANRGQKRLLERGGGAQDMTWRYIPAIKSLIIHLHIDTCDAMGANIVNTMCEKVSALMPELFDCAIGLRILTNLTDRRLARVGCKVPAQAFTSHEFDGREVVQRIVMAYEFAAHDVYRATTNNKGIMNGIDPVLIATGNDWRAIEAGAHAYACRSGTYQPMTRWWLENAEEKPPWGNRGPNDTDDTEDKVNELFLHGELELPMAVGTVGGVTKLHPTAQAALKLLGNPSSRELAEIVCAVGLAQNLSALRALASEGIQRGHMSLHRSNLDLLERQGATKV